MTSASARLALAATFLALAACGGAQQDAPAAPEPVASPAALPTEPPAPATAAAAIPARFLGVWDAETGTCDPASDLRLDITPRAIGFYESLGTVTAMTESKDGSVVITLAMEGEGEKWDQTIKLELIRSDGAEWLLSLPGPDSDVVLRPIRHKRCPA
ncbi:MAG: hypothetical protein NBV68_04290 [Erythrobacter sp.]|uniref:hypothetical protein n=1 Tax=Erythrobacter sp. TaxID=1042 RepID=UPI0025DCFFD7|nr:hypothetical protein [Erythrobacter sp.]MCL9998577.1 hypothetical protein [Erythrobacter sp.]